MALSHPALNAALNAASAALLVAGYWAIRRRRTGIHLALMAGACATSATFLVSYLAYHARVGSVRFEGTGWIRPVYFAILLTHTVLAVAMVPFILRTLYLAMRRRFRQHGALARWTLPVWLYVSISGVAIYVLLYRIPGHR
jgi:putative membrane protein